MFDTYARLAAPFEVTFRDVRGGVEVTFISGEQVVRRGGRHAGCYQLRREDAG